MSLGGRKERLPALRCSHRASLALPYDRPCAMAEAQPARRSSSHSAAKLERLPQHVTELAPLHGQGSDGSLALTPDGFARVLFPRVV